MPIAQRIGALSKAIIYKETTYDTDPGVPDGQVAPLSDSADFSTTNNLIDAPIFNGLRQPYGVVDGMITAEGGLPLNLEFTFIGYLLKVFFGDSASAYSRVNTEHNFFIPTTEGIATGSCQIEYKFGETTAQYIRHRGVRIGKLGFTYEAEGVGKYTLDAMGCGDQVVGTTPLDATPTNDGYVPASYFNGSVLLNTFGLTGLTAFNIDIDQQLSREDAFFSGGLAAGINGSNVLVSGTMELIFGLDGSNPENNLTFYNYAVNQTEVPLECMWTDKPLALATKWLRMQMPTIRLGRGKVTPGGNAGLKISQPFKIITSGNGSHLPAENFGTVIGPYTIGASANLGVKVDGGGTITVPITQGPQTAAQVVAILNAFGGFNAVATADVFNGRVRIKSKSVLAASSVQIDGGVANSCHAVLGFDTTARTGFRDCPLLIRVFNAKNSDY